MEQHIITYGRHHTLKNAADTQLQKRDILKRGEGEGSDRAGKGVIKLV